MGKKRFEQLSFTVALLAATILIGYWLAIATFPHFYFFNPLKNPNIVRRVELTVSTVGWVLLSTGSPIILFLTAAGKKGAIRFLPFTALLWPVSLIVSHITLDIETGNAYVSYLHQFPIFIFTDILLPILTLIAWFDLRQPKKSKISA